MRKAQIKKFMAAGVTKEQIKQAEKAVATDKKRLNRQNKAMERQGITVTLFSYLENTDDMLERVMNRIPSDTPEDICIVNESSRLLNEALSELSEDDREFIEMLYFEEEGVVNRMAKRLGVPRETVRDHRDRLLRTLKRK